VRKGHIAPIMSIIDHYAVIRWADLEKGTYAGKLHLDNGRSLSLYNIHLWCLYCLAKVFSNYLHLISDYSTNEVFSFRNVYAWMQLKKRSFIASFSGS